METKTFLNNNNEIVYYEVLECLNPIGNIFIAHGMAEHPKRYENLANYFINNHYNVYLIHHLGHGEHAKILGHMDQNDFDKCISNLNELIELIHKQNNLPSYLIAHSMGSFMGQIYITRYNNIQGLILSGSTKANLTMKMGIYITSLVKLFSKDLTVPSKTLDKLTFGSYNKKFKKENNKFAWLTKDKQIVNDYNLDPSCGFIGTKGFFYNLSKATHMMNQKKYLKNINKNLPIYIMSGKDDPVSNYGKGAIKLFKQYQKLHIKNLKITIYETDRHEIFNELDKENIYQDSLDFIKTI